MYEKITVVLKQDVSIETIENLKKVLIDVFKELKISEEIEVVKKIYNVANTDNICISTSIKELYSLRDVYFRLLSGEIEAYYNSEEHATFLGDIIANIFDIIFNYENTKIDSKC